MTAWTILSVWLVGWLLAIRPAMRRRMTQQVCTRCDEVVLPQRRPEVHSAWYGHTPAYVIRGAMRERDGYDVAEALWRAAWWPAPLTWWLVTVAARLAGRGVMTAVVRAAPLTAPELERRIAEQHAEIERLTRQIGGH